MTIGWLDNIAEANSYFVGERLETVAWDALVSESGGKDEKVAVLKMAYNRIRHCKAFGIPASPTAEQLEKLKTAQLEAAYYLAMHLSSEDRRKGLMAQGVAAAGVVKESYSEKFMDKLALPAIVYELLDSMRTDQTPFFAADIDRDEDYPSDEDVTDML